LGDKKIVNLNIKNTDIILAWAYLFSKAVDDKVLYNSGLKKISLMNIF
jgi:hypothetical protein